MAFREYIKEAVDYTKEIATMAGLRPQAVKTWIEDNNINAYDLMQSIGQKKTDYKDVMTAVAGKPDNKISKELAKKFSK